ncbi:uncharacterized protein LOC110854399 isoform X2 [Folsomia candida]|uniref:uncharacterized protein LOC110854399 isoform X2 n=1 Tax=Folsomia candida TaxID=158441 RepID=UPI000B8FF57C|nr:uncharacterized protein LOC110854399 isoform X2 [Folsomia candida]
MHLIFRYGLPPGSALVLVAVLQVVNLLFNTCVDWVAVLAIKEMGYDFRAWEEYTWLVLILLEILTTVIFLVYGVVLKGNKSWLIYWMGTYTGFLAISIFIELFYIDWSFKEISPALTTLYLILMMTAMYAYAINLGVNCLPYFNTISDLEPIGKGWTFIVDFYKSHVKEASALVLMFEIVLNAQIFLDRQTTRFIFQAEFVGYEDDKDIALLIEETALRYIRIALAAIGFYIVYKEKKYWMFRFCFCYLLTIAISTGIFVYLLFMWRSDHVLLTLVYFFILLINIVYRLWVLFICVKYTDVFERSGIPM